MKPQTPPHCQDWQLRLREEEFIRIAGCFVNPVVLQIRDDGPALLDDLYPRTGATRPDVEPAA